MDSDSLQQLADWSAQHPWLTLLLIAAVAFAESLALVGLLVPGALLLFALMAMVALGELSLGLAMLAGLLGALGGDVLSYLLGQRHQHRLVTVWPFSRHQQVLIRGRVFFDRYGAMGLIIGRVVGATRPITPLVAGMMGMPIWKFAPVILTASLIWAPIYLLPGYVFGQSLDVAAEVAGRLALLLALVALTYVLVRLALRTIQKGLFSPLVHWLEKLWRRAQRRPRIAHYTDWLDDPKQPQRGSLGPLLLHCASLSVAWLSISWATWRNAAPLNDLLSWVLLDWREPWLDRLMLAVAGLGHPVVTLSITVLIGLWFRNRRRHRTAWLWLAGVMAGIVLMRAWYVTSESQVATSWLGLGDAGVVVLLGSYAVLVSSQLPKRPRFSSYLWTSTLVLCVMAAQVYLGATSVFAAVTGIALGSAWASALGIAYRIGHRRHFLARALTRQLQVMLVLGLSFGAWWHYDSLANRYRINPGAESISMEAWQRPLPLTLTALRHPRTQLAAAVNAERLAARLRTMGFEPLPAFDPTQLFQVLRPDPELNDLPVLPRTRYGQPPAVAMLRYEDHSALIVRLWQSNATLGDGDSLLIGSLNRQRIGQRGYFFSLREETPVDRQTLSQFAQSLAGNGAQVTPQDPRRDGSWLWLARISRLSVAPSDEATSASDAPGG